MLVIIFWLYFYVVMMPLVPVYNLHFFKQELQQDVANHSDLHRDLDNTAEGITQVCVEEVSSVEDDIQNLDKRWDELNKNLKDKLADIETLQGQVKEYRDTVDSVDEKISGVESEFNLERAPVSDVEEMKKHIQDLGSLKKQVEELKPDVQSALEAGNSIQEGNPSADTTAVESDNNNLQEHYAALEDKIASAIEKNKKILEDLEEYWEQQDKVVEQVKETGDKLGENKPVVMDVEKLKEQLEKAKVRHSFKLTLICMFFLLTNAT